MIQPTHLTDAVICRQFDTVLEVSRILRDTQRRHIIVLNERDEPIGIISAVDVNNRVVAEERNPALLLATDIMTGRIQTISVDDSYETGYRMMTELGTYSLPVVRNGKLLGLLEFTAALRNHATMASAGGAPKANEVPFVDTRLASTP